MVCDCIVTVIITRVRSIPSSSIVDGSFNLCALTPYRAYNLGFLRVSKQKILMEAAEWEGP